MQSAAPAGTSGSKAAAKYPHNPVSTFVPARYYVYDPVTGKQITSGYYSSQKTATLVYAPGAGKEYTIR